MGALPACVSTGQSGQPPRASQTWGLDSVWSLRRRTPSPEQLASCALSSVYAEGAAQPPNEDEGPVVL